MGTPRVTAEIKTITPSEAQRLLALNTHNRNVRRQVVERYAADMAAGDWKLNGEAIVLNGDDTLIDGQHRLLACISAGKSFKSLIVQGVAVSAQETIDSGAKRSVADALRLRGEVNCAVLGGVISTAQAWADGTIGHNHPKSIMRVLHYFERYPEIRNAVRRSAPLKSLTLSSVAGAWDFFVHGKVSTDEYERFFHQLSTGEMIGEGDPAYALRRYFLNAREGNARLGKVHHIGALTKAWNAYITGRRVGVIAWRAAVEELPPLLDSNGVPIDLPL